jgi:hypothetical protein
MTAYDAKVDLGPPVLERVSAAKAKTPLIWANVRRPRSKKGNDVTAAHSCFFVDLTPSRSKFGLPEGIRKVGIREIGFSAGIVRPSILVWETNSTTWPLFFLR